MSRKLLLNFSILAVASALCLTGCRTDGTWFWQKPKAKTGTIGSGNGSTPPPLPDGGGDINSAGGSRPELNSGNYHAGQFTPVYFDYDSATIKPSEFTKLNTVAEALKGNAKKLVIEGHTDERGTAEYNRALGERRAEAAMKALATIGVDSSRMTTISYGKERPAEPAHDDTAWSRNRRCEFVIVGD